MPYFLACQALKRRSDLKTAPYVTQLHVFMPFYIHLTQTEMLGTEEWLYWFSLRSTQPYVLFLQMSGNRDPGRNENRTSKLWTPPASNYFQLRLFSEPALFCLWWLSMDFSSKCFSIKSTWITAYFDEQFQRSTTCYMKSYIILKLASTSFIWWPLALVLEEVVNSWSMLTLSKLRIILYPLLPQSRPFQLLSLSLLSHSS